MITKRDFCRFPRGDGVVLVIEASETNAIPFARNSTGADLSNPLLFFGIPTDAHHPRLVVLGQRHVFLVLAPGYVSEVRKTVIAALPVYVVDKEARVFAIGDRPYNPVR
jgi:hypothetical protein